MCIIITFGFLLAGLIGGNENFFLIGAIFGIGGAIELASSRIVNALEKMTASNIVNAIKDMNKKSF